MKNWVDAHSHLTDFRPETAPGHVAADLDSTLARAKAAGISHHVQGGIGPEDWARQLRARLRHPELIPALGLHPYWVADHDAAACEAALDELAKLLPRVPLLGETGLDFREHVVKDSHARQMDCFEAQLDMAEWESKPLVLHCVRAFDEVSKFLAFRQGKVRGFYHAFTGSLTQARQLNDLGFLVSIGGAVCARSPRLEQAIAGVDLDWLLVETDAPDQKPEGWPDAHNAPESLLWVAREVARIKQVTPEEVLARSRANLQKLLGPGWL